MSETVSSADVEAAYRAELAAATERNGNLCVQLAAVKLERDALRREVDALVGHNDKEGNCPSGEWECLEDPEGKFVDNCCRECWGAWAKQQAGQAGKDVNNG